MTNFFDTIACVDPKVLRPLKEYISSHSPEQMLVDIRASKFDPNYMLDLGDMARLFFEEEGCRHARVLYKEGIRQLEAEPARVIEGTTIDDAKWCIVACCLDLEDDYLDAFNIVAREDFFIRKNPDMSLDLAFRLWAHNQFNEAAEILDKLDTADVEFEEYESGDKFSKVKLWVADALGKMRPE